MACLFVVGALLFVVYERAADSAADQLLSDTPPRQLPETKASISAGAHVALSPAATIAASRYSSSLQASTAIPLAVATMG